MFRHVVKQANSKIKYCRLTELKLKHILLLLLLLDFLLSALLGKRIIITARSEETIKIELMLC